jgi:uncharacterized protein YbjT (DUF2867 family)
MRTIVVAGATGLQGGAVVRQLLADGFRVRALSRDPTSPSAQALASRGVEVVQGSFDDAASLDRACTGVDGLFAMATPFGKGGGVDSEEQHGKNLADAAKRVGVGHTVYSSVGGAERGSGVPHFESKWRVEEHMRAIGLRVTVLRPAVFMDMLANASLPMRMMFYAMLSAEIPRHKTLQLVAVDDIAAFTSLAFQHPNEYADRAIELAGDALTIPEMAQTFQRATGKWFGRMFLPRAIVRRMPAELSRMMRWFGEHGFQADIPALRARHAGLKTFEQMLKK